MRVWNRASLARACVLRAPKRTQPARRADGREKEEEVAVVEEGAEKERRLNRRAERKVREAATPVPANINNINNNNNTDRRGVYRAAARGVHSERLSRCVSPRAAVIIGVCAGIAEKEVVNRSRQNYAKPGKYEHCCPTTGRRVYWTKGKRWVLLCCMYIYTYVCFFLSPSIYRKFHRGCARMPVCAMSLAHGNERVYRRWISERDLCYYAYPRLVAPSCLQCVFSVSWLSFEAEYYKLCFEVLKIFYWSLLIEWVSMIEFRKIYIIYLYINIYNIL